MFKPITRIQFHPLDCSNNAVIFGITGFGSIREDAARAIAEDIVETGAVVARRFHEGYIFYQPPEEVYFAESL